MSGLNPLREFEYLLFIVFKILEIDQEVSFIPGMLAVVEVCEFLFKVFSRCPELRKLSKQPL